MQFDRQRDRFLVRGTQGILRKQVQNVGQQQFLMLLLVMTAQLNDFERPLAPAAVCKSCVTPKSTYSRYASTSPRVGL